MFRKVVAFMSVPLFVAGAALAAPTTPPPQPAPPTAKQVETPETAAKLRQAFSVLHAVNENAITFSKMADKRAKSDLVKGYANTMTTSNGEADTKLQRIAKQEGIEIVALDPTTEGGKSLIDRFKAEGVLLGSLEGDAWDKEYMVLVTNTQQSVIRALQKHRALAKSPAVKQYLGELIVMVQNRLKTSQAIMAKIYGDEV